MTISQRIFQIMLEKGLTQKDLAEFANIPTSTVSTWKKRDVNPAIEYIPQIAEFLGVSMEYLITGEEKDTSNNSNNSGVLINGNAQNSHNKIITHSNDTEKATSNKNIDVVEFEKIIKKLSPREKTKLMNMVYEFEENQKGE